MSWQAMKAQILLSISWIGLEKQIYQVIRDYGYVIAEKKSD